MSTETDTSSWGLANPKSPWQVIVLACLVALVSYFVARLGWLSTVGPNLDWPLWLGNALVASILLLVPRRLWLIVIAAAHIGFLGQTLLVGLPVRSIILLILSDIIEVLFVAFCLSHVFRGVPRLNSVRALAKFFLFGVILPPFVGAFLAAAALPGNYWVTWRIDYFSEPIVYLTLMPATLGWFGKERIQNRDSRTNLFEAAALIAGLIVVGYFALAAPVRYSSPILLYALVPFLLWAALRFGTTGVSSSVIAIACVAMWGAAHGRGPFIGSRLFDTVPSFQLFLFSTAVPFMVLAAIVEEKKQASEQLFRSIFDNAQIGIGVFKIDSQEHVSNRALHEMLGYSGEELSGVEQWDRIVPAEERDPCARRYAELVQGKKENDEYEQHFIDREGRVFLGNSRFRLVRDSAGKPKYVVALTEDVTERRRAADALAASEQLFHTVFDNAQISIGILNTKTGEFVNNRALSEMLGYSEQELSRTEQWDEIVHADDRASGAQEYAALVQGKADKLAWEQRYIRRDGKIVIGKSRFKLVRDADGEPHYVVGLSEDVTEYRRAEKELHEAHETLAQQLLAINNELELARQTQLSILPKNTPHLPGLEIAARYVPMSAVAGDFYDFVVVDEKHVGILIADVSGHGLSAALVASMLKSALSAQLPHASDPAMVLSGLNQALFGKFETHFVTAAYVFVDMANNTVSYAGAAHPPLLWWHADTQHASECLENGVMLGPFRDSTYSAMTFTLEKGDEIILVTDGILEAEDSSGDQFGMDRLRRMIDSNHALSVNPFADALLVGLSTWSESTIGPGQTDDITLIVAGFQACSCDFPLP